MLRDSASFDKHLRPVVVDPARVVVDSQRQPAASGTGWFTAARFSATFVKCAKMHGFYVSSMRITNNRNPATSREPGSFV
jgi:hypothetical protein